MQFLKQSTTSPRSFVARVPIAYTTPAPEKAPTHMKVSVCYALGGVNYFNGSTDRRGYRVDIRPVTWAPNSGCESFMLFGDRKQSGGYLLLKAADRYNARQLQVLAERIDPLVPKIIEAFNNNVDCEGLRRIVGVEQ
jgi:hypothetical protein